VDRRSVAKLGDADAQARADNPAGRDFSEALARGLRVIGAFEGAARALSLSDLARAVGLPRATVRRTLITLTHLGYVEASGRTFSLTARVLSLAGAYLDSSAATSVLQPACERLSAVHGETFSMAMLDGASAVMVAYARPTSMYLLGAGIGLRIPAHCSAVGRVLIAGLDESRRSAFLDGQVLEAITPHTNTDRERLARIVDEVAVAGFAMVEHEVELGFRSLAVPVCRRDGRPTLALNLGMPSMRGTVSEVRDHFLPILRAEAIRLQGMLL
jgi:IclR family pca regulon transcriptional regulator